MLTVLTDEMRAALRAHVDYWTRVGLSTEPMDRERAAAAVRACYAFAGMAEPRIEYAASFGDRVCLDSVGAKVRAKVRDEVRDEVWDEVGAKVGDEVGDEVGYEVRAKVGDEVGDEVWGEVWAEVGASVWSGQYDAGSCAWGRFFADACGVEFSPATRARMDAWCSLVESCGGVYWGRDVAVIVDRPAAIRRDETGRLHSTSALAVEYRDGWGIAAVRGTRVPNEWVLQPLDPRTVLTEPNVERRMAAAAIVGWDAVLRSVDARVIDRDPNPMFGELLEADLPDSPGQRFLRAQCGTGRTVVVLASRDARTAVEAGAMSYGVPVEKYRTMKVRT